MERYMEENDIVVQEFCKFIRDRITELRMKKDVSENRMSLELGNGRSYINNIVSGRILPSMEQFLQICTYLDVTPEQFFRGDLQEPSLVKETSHLIEGLDKDELLCIQQMAHLLLRK